MAGQLVGRRLDGSRLNVKALGQSQQILRVGDLAAEAEEVSKLFWINWMVQKS
jgi:hypothetical protein